MKCTDPNGHSFLALHDHMLDENQPAHPLATSPVEKPPPCMATGRTDALLVRSGLRTLALEVLLA